MMATYDEQVTAVKDRYAERIVKVLEGIRATLQEAGYTVDEPADFSGDDYRWTMLVYVESKPGDDKFADGDIDITLQIAESMQHDGTEDGINFALDIVEVGGRIRGGLTPYNYTGDVWVDVGDDDSVEDRFAIFEQADPYDIVALVEGN
jgi:ABC-type transport system substrate-binding protein